MNNDRIDPVISRFRIASSDRKVTIPMPRKSAKTPVVVPAPVQEKPAIVLPPKTKVEGEGKFTDDGNTLNKLIVQKVSVPIVSKFKNTTSTTIKDYLRILIRPDESHDEPHARWDEHEPEDEAALKQLFSTYGKGSGTTISIRLNIDGAGKDEFFLDVRLPKSDDDEDAKHPAVLVDPKGSIGDIVLDLFYEMSGDDPPGDFKGRGSLEDLVGELEGDVEELEPIRALLSEFDMPGDMPANLYSLPDRLRSIFRAAKGLPK